MEKLIIRNAFSMKTLACVVIFFAASFGAQAQGDLRFEEETNVVSPQEVTIFRTAMMKEYFPGGLTAGPDGNMWFLAKKARKYTSATERNNGIVGKITPSGVVTEYSKGITESVIGMSPNSIVTGPDGNIWFLESNKIARSTPDGVITEFPCGVAGGRPLISIVAGTDGNLWFTWPDGIGKITTSGKVTGYHQGITPSSFIWAITPGPDGNMWFTETAVNSDRIGKITPDGVVTEYSEGITEGALSRAITAGSDGNLWFVEEGAGRIGKITVQGAVTEYKPSGVINSALWSIASGSDGNVWYSDAVRGIIGKIDLEGKVTEFAIKSATVLDVSGAKKNTKIQNFQTSKIVFSPDGSLWFTGTGDVSFGRLHMPLQEGM